MVKLSRDKPRAVKRVRAGEGEGTFDNAFRKLKEKQSTMNMLTDKLKKMKVDGPLLSSDVDVVVVDAKIEEETTFLELLTFGMRWSLLCSLKLVLGIAQNAHFQNSSHVQQISWRLHVKLGRDWSAVLDGF